MSREDEGRGGVDGVGIDDEARAAGAAAATSLPTLLASSISVAALDARTRFLAEVGSLCPQNDAVRCGLSELERWQRGATTHLAEDRLAGAGHVLVLVVIAVATGRGCTSARGRSGSAVSARRSVGRGGSAGVGACGHDEIALGGDLLAQRRHAVVEWE